MPDELPEHGCRRDVPGDRRCAETDRDLGERVISAGVGEGSEEISTGHGHAGRDDGTRRERQ